MSEQNLIEFYNVEIEDLSKFKGLIVTDFHLWKNPGNSAEDDLLLIKLKEVVEETCPTHIFILGDIIHYSNYRTNDSYFKFFDKLDQTFTIPIHIIPGNHDYDSSYKCCFSLYAQGKYVKTHVVDFLQIKFSDSFSLFLGHDAKYNIGAHEKPNVIKWMNKIRRYRQIRNVIKNSDVLIVGHTHENIDDDETNNYSIAPFSLSYKNDKSSYGIISFNGNFRFEHEKWFNFK